MADWHAALEASKVLAKLAAFDPHVAGTFPLGLNVAGSDIDVLCHALDADAFAAAVWSAFGDAPGFSMHQWNRPNRPVIAGFALHEVPFEIFGSPVPVAEQAGWRHFEIERQLLALGGGGLRDAVVTARQEGLKTEPAFAQVLGLKGDAYAALLELRELDGTALARIMPSR